MKIQGAKKVHYDSGPNMTPLVDVVMVILIFLMLAGSFVSEKYLVSDVPVQKEGAGGASDKAVVPKTFNISVRQNGIFYTATAGKFATVDSSKDPAQAYIDLFRALDSQGAKIESIGENPDDYLVLIAPTNQVTLENLMAVESAAIQAKFKKVGFRVGGGQ